MKLSKKNVARQRAIQKAIASGKTLGGLIAGLTAAAVVGGCKDTSPAHTMGSYPRPQQQANATSENIGEFVTGGAIAAPEDNDVRPEQDVAVPPPIFMDKLPDGCYRVQIGDTLTQIAKAHGTTVTELKRLNGFDDYRADRIRDGEIIKVPSHKPNAVNEDRSNALHVKGKILLKK